MRVLITVLFAAVAVSSQGLHFRNNGAAASARQQVGRVNKKARGAKAKAAAIKTPAAKAPGAFTPAEPLGNRFADGTGSLLLTGQTEHSGCGIHRDCYTCMSGTYGRCIWSGPAQGCITSGGLTMGLDPLMGVLLCSAEEDNAVGKVCPQIDNCKSCTESSGCIWNRGSCVYSRGDGCLHDPINCANYAYQCPSDTPLDPFKPMDVASVNGEEDKNVAAPVSQGQNNNNLLMTAMLLGGGLGGGQHGFGGVHHGFGGGHNAFSGRYTLGGGRHGGSGGHHGGMDPLVSTMLFGAENIANIPGATFFADRDVGMLNGLVGESINQWSGTTDVEENGIMGLPAGQFPLCMPGDYFCSSAAMDPFAPHNLAPAYDLLDGLGFTNTNELWYPEYHLDGMYTAPDYRADVIDSLPPPAPVAHYTATPAISHYTGPTMHYQTAAPRAHYQSAATRQVATVSQPYTPRHHSVGGRPSYTAARGGHRLG